MRSIFVAIVLLIVLIAPLSAQEEGFIGPGTDTNMVKAADLSSLDNYSQVLLTGHVTQKLDRSRYQFQDSSGTATLSIDDDLWSGLTVTPNDLLEIQGEVNLNSLDGPRVEVSQITKISPIVVEGSQPALVGK